MGNNSIILDILVLTRCKHPSKNIELDLEMIRKIIEIIGNDINNVIFIVSGTQYKRYKDFLSERTNDLNEESIRIMGTLLNKLKSYSPHKKNKINKEKRKIEYDELEELIRKEFNKCRSDRIFICIGKLFNENELVNTLKVKRNIRSIKKYHRNAEIYYIEKEV